MAAGYYHFMKWMDYEDANPGQDATHPSEQAMAERKSRSRRKRRELAMICFYLSLAWKR